MTDVIETSHLYSVVLEFFLCDSRNKENDRTISHHQMAILAIQ